MSFEYKRVIDAEKTLLPEEVQKNICDECKRRK